MATHSTNPGSLAAVARACCYGGAALANRPGVGSYHHDNLLPRLVSQDDCGWSRIAIWIHNSQNSGSRSQHNNKQEAVQRHCRWDVPSNQKFGELYPLWRMEHMTPGERGETERKKEKRHKETRQERWRHFTPSAASEIPSNFFWSVSNIFALFIFVPHLWNKISSSGKEENACREDKERGRTREFMRASGRERNKTGVCFRNVCSCYTFGVRSSLKRTFIEKRKREARARRERERESWRGKRGIQKRERERKREREGRRRKRNSLQHCPLISFQCSGTGLRTGKAENLQTRLSGFNGRVQLQLFSGSRELSHISIKSLFKVAERNWPIVLLSIQTTTLTQTHAYKAPALPPNVK